MNGGHADFIRLALEQAGYNSTEAETFLCLVGVEEEWIGERETARELGIGHTTLYRWRNGEPIKRTGLPFPDELKWRQTPAGTIQYELGSVRRYMLSLTKSGTAA